MFWSKPCSLALPEDSPLRIEEPHYEGIKRIVLKMLLFYSKQSISIRGANVVYKRIITQVDKPAIYEGTSLLFVMNMTMRFPFYLSILSMAQICLLRPKSLWQSIILVANDLLLLFFFGMRAHATSLDSKLSMYNHKVVCHICMHSS